MHKHPGKFDGKVRNWRGEYMKHLRASDRSGFKRGGMKREYWQEWRAKAKADLRKKMEEAENEEEGGDCVS